MGLPLGEREHAVGSTKAGRPTSPTRTASAIVATAGCLVVAALSVADGYVVILQRVLLVSVLVVLPTLVLSEIAWALTSRVAPRRTTSVVAACSWVASCFLAGSLVPLMFGTARGGVGEGLVGAALL